MNGPTLPAQLPAEHAMIPVVVSYASETARHDAAFADELRALAQGAARAISATGLDARWVNAAAPDADADDLVAAARGVIVLGGADVDPALYGAHPDGAWMDSADAAADAFEAALIGGALERGVPLLTICRGTQLLNVVCGGTLIQDLGDGMHREPNQDMVTHPVEIHAGTHLAEVLGAGAHDVRSGHHQAVGTLGTGLVVSAIAPDGVVEAIEGQDARWIVGVQWHPEEAESDPAQLQLLLADFASAARESGPIVDEPARIPAA
ncbi:gamma-glutamyl-gamma-aminobutyrate hydrolase family protein [Microbacterium aquimaris]|uniref:Gamma-glutamyl-gamma-aminobutyrate hydrolase family protein n=1 Tax=Microbacterium aquimaris TaxID=459816 RepID=A0ABU5N3V3_9MICO|nr:gamma-glutamyl-gamma-aminobutyrate hydrolase family protein [Microbacterium aquimaris]MDZ8160750.1 gamma-glutamyl-gamma-aminobutyrate hydrolase family protein [Microbacterium aquimaris]